MEAFLFSRMEYILLIVGFALLIKASDFLVDGASSVAKRAGLSDYVVGLTVVAFATSLPELVVNMLAVINGTSGMALGNVVGSNTLNILVVVGITAVIAPMVVKGRKMAREILMTLLLSILLLGVACDDIFSASAQNVVSRIDGIILLALFVVFLFYIFRKKNAPEEPKSEVETIKKLSAVRSTVYLAIGVAGLFLGGKLIVDSASQIAASFGMSDTVIGLTVVALGTSLPEIVTSIIASKRISAEMALGNVLGSNIFNGLLILGLTSVMMPVSAENGFSPLDLYVTMLGSVALLVCILFIGRIGRMVGAMFLAVYVFYVLYILNVI
ncbi:MAG: calcium/sodium antiporter [Flavobacteriales bacterium]|nr:calcium/sodium antiporter [Flavobacteriales bacterium]